MNITKPKILILFAIILASQILSCVQQEKQPVDYVDPFICTQDDHGHWHPSALAPFGLVKLGPDTYPGSLKADGDFGKSGYNYSDDMVRGFSHSHKGSSGGGPICDRAGRLSIMPFTKTPTSEFLSNPLASIDKRTEKASPGYYSVNFADREIIAELTASTHVGFHKYIFEEGKNAQIFLNEGNKERSAYISVKKVNDYRLEGYLAYYAGIYFTVEFNQPITSFKTWDGKKLEQHSAIDKQNDGGVVCDFGDLKGEALLIKVGLSLTGNEAAQENLLAECPDWNFNKIKRQTSDLWNKQLSAITVEGKNEEDKTIFYTALYHSCFLPIIQSDVDGNYRGIDREVHKAEGYKHYNGYAFWDSFRSKYPLYSLFAPDVYRDIVKSLRDMYFQAGDWSPFPESTHKPHSSGFLVRGKTGGLAHSSCRHEHMLMVMTDAYFKNLFDIELETVYPHIRKETMLQMPEKYDEIGYIPARPDQTGEYSWDSWSVAQLAKELGNEDDYKYFMKRSEYWRNTWDPSIKFFRARAADGSWLDFPEDRTINREKYTYEGTKWQFRWNVLHDVDAMIDLFEGKENFVDSLNYFFENDLYTAGNQIDLHIPFLYNFAGAPWLTQKWVHKILKEPMVQLYATHGFFPEPIYSRIYKATPDGYLQEMDCDYGCMASWYNMSAMGLFQVCPGDPVYQISSPIFDKITIQADPKVKDGKAFVIKAKNLSKDNHFIQSATLNGEPINRCWIKHDEIAKGGELVLEMGPEPNKLWGTDDNTDLSSIKELNKANINHQNLMVYYDDDGKEQPIKSSKDWEKRKEHILKGMQEAMGPLPVIDKNTPELDVKIHETVKTDLFERRKISLQVEEDHRLYAYLYVPAILGEGEKLAAMLVCHSTHKQGKDVTAGLTSKKNRSCALELARRGYVVIAPDYPSFGDDSTYNFATDQYISGSMKGIYNHMRCADYLSSLDFVDENRLGVIGHSLGGHNSMFVAAFDQRFKAIVASCGWTPFHNYYNGNIEGWTSDVYMPLLSDVYQLDPDLVPFDFYEVVGALAPRAFFSNSPIHDSNFEVQGVKNAITEARKVYALYGAEQKLQVRYPDDKHDFPEQVRAEAYNFLDQVLEHVPVVTQLVDY
ncbi:alpha/beta fold hydrolase [Maribellus luteus]|uniref:Alpha/beta fold hydrolase n=1 Tax=Maribellus luteus TaxID=2305463 RepID=A0A399T8K2_9BACT|nr:GH92 family glycosyl hydrolase [Maribellus luteus]RIJ50537.1 alpha/beta fold hydrolase [Maribellus luteus]